MSSFNELIKKCMRLAYSNSVSLSDEIYKATTTDLKKLWPEYGYANVLGALAGLWSFDKATAFNESEVLIAAVEQYFERTGHYSESILTDKTYRNRNNLAYCREHGIRMSGPFLGRPKKDAGTDKKTEYKDNADRIAVEGAFALVKQKYGLELITRRLDETAGYSIALSFIAMNVDRICRFLFRLFYNIIISRYKQHELMLILIQKNNVKNFVCC